jgi:adenine-specific DNA-methyltransferase
MERLNGQMQIAEFALPPPATSFDALRAELRSLAGAGAEHRQLEFAQAVTIAAVEAYWSKLAPAGIALAKPPCGIDTAIADQLRRAAGDLGASAATLDTRFAAYHLSLLYTGLLPPDWRTKHGMFFTPPALADRLLDQAEAAGLDWSKARILDPAAGAGAFLIPAAQRLLRSLGPCTPPIALQNLSTRLAGYELDPFAAWLSQVFIEAAALPLLIAGKRRPAPFVEVRDTLKETLPAEFDLVIGNPPFGKVTLTPAQRVPYARSLYGHANLYGLFMDRAVQLARPGGLVSFLTPSSFLAGEYFKNLRSVLWREAPPVSLDFVHLRKGVFEDVLQETILATYRKAGCRKPAKVSFLHPLPGQPLVAESAGTFTLPREASAPWVLPRHANESGFAQNLGKLPERLADWGYQVSTGPLVWNRFKPQLLDRHVAEAVPLVWAECITSDGRFVLRSEKRKHKPYFLPQPGDDWLIVRQACVLLQRTTAKEQARRLIAAEMPASFMRVHGGVTVENHLNMLVPLHGKPVVSPALLAAFLNCSAADRAFRCLSGSVAVSAYELESMPLPSATELKKRLRGRTDAAAVETACNALYGESGTA